MSENTAPAAPATPAAPRRKKTSRTLFEFTGKAFAVESKENPEGLHKAAAAWLDVLKEAGRPMDRDECLKILATRDTGTTQQPIRIIYYWKKALVDQGFIRLTRKGAKPGEPATAAVPPPVATPAAPAAQPTA